MDTDKVQIYSGYVCEKCGSENVSLSRSDPREAGLLAKVSDALGKLTNPGPMRGKTYVACKDCGHVSVLMIL